MGRGGRGNSRRRGRSDDGSLIGRTAVEAGQVGGREDHPHKGKIALTGDLRVGSNTSLIGVGADAKLIGGGVHLSKVRNVVIRNLAIAEASDAVSIEASQQVWIDHCDLSDCRDGLLDIKRGSDFITVSWNHFHGHHKTCLLGHSDKACQR